MLGPPLLVSVEKDGRQTMVREFTETFKIGRDDTCDISIDSGLASRYHAEVKYEEGQWWVEDLGSTNGTYMAGRRIERETIRGHTCVQLGRNGCMVHLTIMEEALASDASTNRSLEETSMDLEAPQPSPSMTRYMARYFGDGEQDGPVGDHTRMIRKAYAVVHKKNRERYVWVVVATLVIAVSASLYGFIQHLKTQRQEQTAAALFYDLKEQDLTIARIQQVVEASGNADISQQLAALQAKRRTMAARYEGYVKSMGRYRKLTDEEKAIYDVARVFNENEFAMPAGFVKAVKEMIDNYWLKHGRVRFARALRSANEKGYTGYIAHTMEHYGLPPEYFYLALQESNLSVNALGPQTRWGIAKGMWQFIPPTASRYGLKVGPRKDMRVVDVNDQRHDFEKSTTAAAKYLLDIYGNMAQASGLLVIASYNWGEHRVVRNLEKLPGPQTIPSDAFDGIPENPKERNYWRFLEAYRDRMPSQTKDYVLKIFAAAVIGHNPRLFGFDFDNPLKPFIESPGA